MFKLTTIFFFYFSLICSAYTQTVLNFEDFDDHDVFNNFSGNSGEWGFGQGTATTEFDNLVYLGEEGSSKKVNYAFSGQSGAAGFWQSIIARNVDKYISLDFTDLYDDLLNSPNNPSIVEDIEVLSFSFWAKGNGSGNHNHVVKVELKDSNNQIGAKTFSIPNNSDWTQYTFLVSEITNANLDLTKMKEIVFGFEGFQNEYRTDFLYFDNLTLETNEPQYDANTWTDEQFLDLVAHRAFFFFLKFTDNLGFTYDRSTFSDLISVASIGYQLSAFSVKVEWAENVEQKVENILFNLVNLPMGSGASGTAGWKGFFYHFLDANTGLRKDSNVELSLYDTMLLMYGVICAKEKFPNNSNIQNYAMTLLNSVQWNWMVDSGNNQFHLGWKPETNEFLGHVDGYTDEATLVDILGLGSPTFPITMDTYNARERSPSINIGSYPENSGVPIVVAWTGSLFNYFFLDGWINMKNCGLDNHTVYPIDIWENNRQAIMANYQFCLDHSDDVNGDGDDNFTTYLIGWGLTAVDNLVPDWTGLLSEYFAIGALPTHQNIIEENPAPHFGTFPVYGAASSINFLPNEALTALRNYYQNTNLWLPLFGFGDAFSTDPHYYEVDPNTFAPILDEDNNLIIHPATWINGTWENHVMLAVDQGPMLLSLVNFLYGSTWELAHNNSIIQNGLDAILVNGSACLESLSIIHEPENPNLEDSTINNNPKKLELFQNYPNPFDFETNISCFVPNKGEVVLTIFDGTGHTIHTENKKVKKGVNEIKIDVLSEFPSGIYFYKISFGKNIETKKMIKIKP